MLIFDRVPPQDVDRRASQLWVLAIGMILILAGGLAVHMYTLVSAQPLSASRNAMLQAIVAFCVLVVLFVGYLIDRCLMIGRLRRRLLQEMEHNLQRSRRDNNMELLRTLLGPGEFRKRLALEIKHATKSKTPLSGLTVSLVVSPFVTDAEEIFSTFGEAVKAMTSKLYGDDSIYQFASGVFGILLPGTGTDVASRVAKRIANGLEEAMGASRRYTFDIRIASFPGQAKNAQEMEQLMRVPHDESSAA